MAGVENPKSGPLANSQLPGRLIQRCRAAQRSMLPQPSGQILDFLAQHVAPVQAQALAHTSRRTSSAADTARLLSEPTAERHPAFMYSSTGKKQYPRSAS